MEPPTILSLLTPSALQEITAYLEATTHVTKTSYQALEKRWKDTDRIAYELSVEVDRLEDRVQEQIESLRAYESTADDQKNRMLVKDGQIRELREKLLVLEADTEAHNTRAKLSDIRVHQLLEKLEQTQKDTERVDMVVKERQVVINDQSDMLRWSTARSERFAKQVQMMQNEIERAEAGARRRNSVVREVLVRRDAYTGCQRVVEERRIALKEMILMQGRLSGSDDGPSSEAKEMKKEMIEELSSAVRGAEQALKDVLESMDQMTTVFQAQIPLEDDDTRMQSSEVKTGGGGHVEGSGEEQDIARDEVEGEYFDVGLSDVDVDGDDLQRQTSGTPNQNAGESEATHGVDGDGVDTGHPADTSDGDSACSKAVLPVDPILNVSPSDEEREEATEVSYSIGGTVVMVGGQAFPPSHGTSDEEQSDEAASGNEQGDGEQRDEDEEQRDAEQRVEEQSGREQDDQEQSGESQNHEKQSEGNEDTAQLPGEMAMSQTEKVRESYGDDSVHVDDDWHHDEEGIEGDGVSEEGVGTEPRADVAVDMSRGESLDPDGVEKQAKRGDTASDDGMEEDAVAGAKSPEVVVEVRDMSTYILPSRVSWPASGSSELVNRADEQRANSITFPARQTSRTILVLASQSSSVIPTSLGGGFTTHGSASAFPPVASEGGNTWSALIESGPCTIPTKPKSIFTEILADRKRKRPDDDVDKGVFPREVPQRQVPDLRFIGYDYIKLLLDKDYETMKDGWKWPQIMAERWRPVLSRYEIMPNHYALLLHCIHEWWSRIVTTVEERYKKDCLGIIDKYGRSCAIAKKDRRERSPWPSYDIHVWLGTAIDSETLRKSRWASIMPEEACWDKCEDIIRRWSQPDSVAFLQNHILSDSLLDDYRQLLRRRVNRDGISKIDDYTRFRRSFITAISKRAGQKGPRNMLAFASDDQFVIYIDWYRLEVVMVIVTGADDEEYKSKEKAFMAVPEMLIGLLKYPFETSGAWNLRIMRLPGYSTTDYRLVICRVAAILSSPRAGPAVIRLDFTPEEVGAMRTITIMELAMGRLLW